MSLLAERVLVHFGKGARTLAAPPSFLVWFSGLSDLSSVESREILSELRRGMNECVDDLARATTGLESVFSSRKTGVLAYPPPPPL